MRASIALLPFAFISYGWATLVNRTIDDQFGDPITGRTPTYSPEDKWMQGATCKVCWARPDKHSAFNGTWHESTYYSTVGGVPHTITISFNGALAVFIQHFFLCSSSLRIRYIYIFHHDAPVYPNSRNYRDPSQYNP
jgi:hypothetical protein